MTRDQCWMTFNEALEEYLTNREQSRHFGPGHNRNECLRQMEIAAEHMDALTSLPDPNTQL